MERRLSQMEKEATRESQRLETRHGTEVKGLQEALTLSREKAEAAAGQLETQDSDDDGESDIAAGPISIAVDVNEPAADAAGALATAT